MVGVWGVLQRIRRGEPMPLGSLRLQKKGHTLKTPPISVPKHESPFLGVVVKDIRKVGLKQCSKPCLLALFREYPGNTSKTFSVLF